MDAPPAKILLATDGSPDAALAARAAVDLSNAMGSELHVAHAWQLVMSYVPYPAGGTDLYEVYERRAQELLDKLVSEIEVLGGTVAGTHVVMNSPIDGMLDLCEELEPGLVVLGSRGLGPVRRILVGSVSEGVVHHASCPVLVVRGGQEAWPPRRVVIGDDGSDDAKGAAKLASRIGGLSGAEGALVRAYPKPLEPIEDWVEPNLRKLYEERPREEEPLEQRAQELEQILGSRPETRTSEGDAAAAILEVAGEGDEVRTLLAVGSRGLGPIGRVRLGSVSTKVLRAAGGPVLVYPHPRR
jgi:nucleotide-binding universal stress UspA family protein